MMVFGLMILPTTALADTAEGSVQGYVAKKKLTLQVRNAPQSFEITSKTKFYDLSGQECPEFANPKEGIWSLSSSVTVQFHKVGNKAVADGVTFPYGKVPTALIGKSKAKLGDNDIARFGAVTPQPGSTIVMNASGARLGIKVGDRLPGYSLKTFDGKTITSANSLRKVMVFDFWATWCGPCKQMSPVMQQISRRFSGKNVTVIGANCMEFGGASAAKAYVKEHSYTFAFATADTLAQKLSVQGIPLVLIVDQKGIVRHLQEDYEAGCGKKFEKVINQLLNAK